MTAVVKTKYPYTARKGDELSFAKGARLELVGVGLEMGWLRCRNEKGSAFRASFLFVPCSGCVWNESVVVVVVVGVERNAGSHPQDVIVSFRSVPFVCLLLFTGER